MVSFLSQVSACVTGLFLPAVLFASGLYFLFRIGRYIFSPRFFMRALGSGKNSSDVADSRINSETSQDINVVAEKRKTRNVSFLKKGKDEKNGAAWQKAYLKEAKKATRTPFSSLCLALAGTLGVGNISGVTAAIMVGGPGAVFWIWISAIVSSVLKYAETVLALRYRQRDESGGYCGGAHLYIKNGLNAPRVSVIFCVMCIITSFTMGCITQTKAASDGVLASTGLSPLICGTIFFVIVLYLSFGGGEKISGFTLKLIPPLCLAYIILSLAVIFVFRENIVYVTSVIFSEAFTFKAGAGGFLGFLFSPAMRYGVTRGIMSNEAGCGTAPIAHARAETEAPVRQGIFGIIEVLCDTLLLCTLTAYAVLVSDVALIGSSTEVAISSFASALGETVKSFLGISIFLFALGSVAGWSFYGQESVKALGFRKRGLTLYGVLFAFCAFLGCVMPENTVWELADLSISVMAIINVSALLLLSPAVIKLTKDFYRKSGKKK